jgi:hypothetical protein
MRHRLAVVFGEAGFAAMRVVDDLVRHADVARLQVGMDAADRGDRDDMADLLFMQRPQVGAVIHQMRRNGVAVAVARHEHDGMAVEIAEGERAGGFAERRADDLAMGDGQAGKFGQAGAADDA